MAEDPVEDARQYLARDEHRAKAQFTTSLEGRSSAELMALLTSKREGDDADVCRGDCSTKSSEQRGRGVMEDNYDDVEGDVPHLLKQQQEEDAASSRTSAVRVVEVSRVETSRDGAFSGPLGSEGQRGEQGEHCSAAWDAVRAGELVTKEELEGVRRELLMQERVVKALEEDNVNLHTERRVLRAKLAELEKRAVNMEAKYSLLTSGQSPNPPPAATPTPVQQQQQFSQDEIHVELERQRTVVRELQLELELIRREKKDVEARLSSLDTKKIEEMELEVRNLRVDLKHKETECQDTVKDMARKIAWYVEHQEFNHAQEELLKQQQDTIRRLRTRLHEVGAMDGEGKHPRVGKDARVRYLTKRVVELEEALNSKHPDSIAQLIRSCQPSVQDSKQFKQLNLRIKELEEALVEKDRCAEAAVTRLRVETDRMKIQYQERIDKLEEDLKLRLLHAQTRRVRELEKHLAEARQALRERSKEKAPPSVPVEVEAAVEATAATSGYVHEKGVDASSAQREPKAVVTATPTGVGNHADEVIALLRQENEALRGQLSQTTSEAVKGVVVPIMSHGVEVGAASTGVISSMQAQISTLIAELAVYKRLLMENQESLRDAHARWEERLLTVRQECQSQMQRMRQEHNDDISRIQEHHQREMKSVAEQQRAEEEASLALQKLAQGPLDGPRHSRAFLQSVAERLAYLERRQVQKERESAHEIVEVKRIADFELALATQKAEMMLEQKNQQIQEFRLQLDQLLANLALLQPYA
ncbi:viral A-type inclusion protein [Trypanosoma grayi]|uniref:viral A-type inclusion protein n=1 Tax=Trypanosoma grayi TaxID=71804 RepID=UPI0004F44DF0|nr:viral A-type inclusion protein [Trypanosoma grayi]KEG12549.1 viral A-type inclusion protein [Trypanosoma grayi]